MKIKSVISVFAIVALMITCSISMVKFDDVNKNKGAVILKIEHDSVGDIDAYNFFVTDSNGNYDKLVIDPQYAQFFHEGDTL
jgi:hypothetical protein